MKILSERRFENELAEERERVESERNRWEETRRLKDHIFELERKIDKLDWDVEKAGVYAATENNAREEEKSRANRPAIR